MIPQAILIRSGRKTINAAKPKAVHNAVKASTCWVWKPKNRVIDHVSKYNNASNTLKRFDYIDTQGRFKWMHRLKGGMSMIKNLMQKLLLLVQKLMILLLKLKIDQDLGSTSGIRACALRNFDLEDIIKKNSILTRKRGLLWFFQTLRKNEVLFSEEVVVLKREVGIKQYEINMLKTEFEKVEQEKDAIVFKIEKFDKASKDLDQLLGSQITDKSKKGFRYSAVPPPHPLIYNRPNKLDMSYSGLDEFKEPEFKSYGPKNSKKESNVVCENQSNNSKENYDKSLIKEQVSQVKSSFVEGCGSNTSKSVSEVEPKEVRKNNDAPIIEDWVSDDEEQDESKTKPEKKTVIPTAALIMCRKIVLTIKRKRG
ncbi:hypothetical protein Tco_1288596 [Tanacetum coccineum]